MELVASHLTDIQIVYSHSPEVVQAECRTQSASTHTLARHGHERSSVASSSNMHSVPEAHVPRDGPGGRIAIGLPVCAGLPVVDPRGAPGVLPARVGRALFPREAEPDRQAAVDELALALVPRVPRRARDLELDLRLVEALALAPVEARRPRQIRDAVRLHLEVVEEVALAPDARVNVAVDLCVMVSSILPLCFFLAKTPA